MERSEPVSATLAPSRSWSGWRRWAGLARVYPGLAVGALLLLLLLLSAALAPVLAPYDPLAGSVSSRLQPPGPAHWLGTDQMGRDVLSRLLYGGRYSLGVAGSVAALSLLIGLAAGTVAGFFGGWVDEVLMRLVDLIKPFPGRILAMVLVGLFGPGLINLGLAMVVASWVGTARIVRGMTLSLREREYVLAARTFGTPPLLIILRHILPGVLPQMAVMASLELSWLIMALSGFSLLGLGAQPPTPEWGMMVGEARAFFRTHPALLFMPSVAIMLAVLGFTLFGEGIRDLLDPQHRKGRGRAW